MNCNDIRERLPGLVYGHLSLEETLPVEEHLAICNACQAEVAALRQLRPLLDALPAPSVQVDLARLYQQAIEKQERRASRWRRAAVLLVSAAAAVLVVAFLLRLEVRLEGHQMVVRWGAVPANPEVAPAPEVRPSEEMRVTENPAPVSLDVEDRLRILTELMELHDKAIANHDRQQQDLPRLKAKLAELERQTLIWRIATERDVAALYASQYQSPPKGLSP